MHASESTPTFVDGAFLLDDLELLRGGVPLLEDEDNPVLVAHGVSVDGAVILEPEGVPIAQIQCVPQGSSLGLRVVRVEHWLSTRPERPFESLHLSVEKAPITDCTMIIKEGAGAVRIESELRARGHSSALLLFPAALEREGQTDRLAVDRVRAIHRELRLLPSELLDRICLVILPVAHDHPYRQSRLVACAAAYARGGEVVELHTARPAVGPDGGGCVVFFTGLSGSGKSTLARALRNRLLERTESEVTLLDGDVVRRHLSAGLGFGAADRDTNIRRIGWVAARIAAHGGLAIASPIAPYAATRDAVRAMTLAAGARFILIHVATPLAECERRDRKGLYARARRGDIADFTGISAPYEEPADPDLRLDTTDVDVATVTKHILDFGVEQGLWNPTLDLQP